MVIVDIADLVHQECTDPGLRVSERPNRVELLGPVERGVQSAACRCPIAVAQRGGRIDQLHVDDRAGQDRIGLLGEQP